MPGSITSSTTRSGRHSLGEPQRGMPVGRVPGLHARMPEIVDHDLGDRRIVVDHENTRAHRSSVGRAEFLIP